MIHLRAVWERRRARHFVDAGSQAGHGLFRNVSDSLLWLNYFDAPGTSVVGLDAFEDFALDLQHRLDDVEPYKSMSHVRKVSRYGAIGATDEEAVSGIDIAKEAAYTYYACSRSDWMNDYERFDRHGASDHVCRIPRQRAGVSRSTLPLPVGRNFSTNPDDEYHVPTVRLRELLPPSGHLDLLKIDVDMQSNAIESELRELIVARAFSVLVLEVDHSSAADNETTSQVIERLNSNLWSHGYALFVKIPCRGSAGMHLDQDHKHHKHWRAWSQRAAYMPLSGKHRTILPRNWGARAASCELGGRVAAGDCGIQDLIALDVRQPELAGLVVLGNKECGTRFAADVTDEWGAAANLALARNLTPGSAYYPNELIGEQERLRTELFRGSAEDTPPKEPRWPVRLPDGSWSCGAMLSASTHKRIAANATEYANLRPQRPCK